MEANTKQIKINGGVEEQSGLSSPNHLAFDKVIHWAMNSSINLKPLRFVSKAWNESICSALRPITIVDIDERDDLKTKAFVELLKGRDVWGNGYAPLPFIKVRIFARSFSQPYFMDFVENFLPEFIVTEFTLEYDSCLSEDFQKHVHQILEHHAATITKLHISRSHSSEIAPKNFSLEKFKFPDLTELNIDFGENVKSFLDGTLAKGKLQKAGISFHPWGSAQLPSSKSLKRVPSLNFTMVAIKKNFPFQKFAKLRLPNLKKVHLICVHEAEIDDAMNVISKWRDWVDEIHFVLAKLPLHRLKIFSKLNVWAFNDGYPRQFDANKYPSLKEMYLCSPPPESCQNVVPRLEFTRLEFYGNGNWNKQVFEAVGRCGKLYPRTENLTLE